MTTEQWNQLLDVLAGKKTPQPPVGFIIDSPWLPGWAGVSILDYYASESVWLEANLKAIENFPQAMFLPGFWSEYGMCTEPSAFGARLVWSAENLPHAEKVLSSLEHLDQLPRPNVQNDGLLPFVVNRLQRLQPDIRARGHEIRFAVSRGPLNIASFLMGTTEFLTGMILDPEKTHAFLTRISEFCMQWLAYQKVCFPSIDGILILDDIVGFVGDRECREFAVPYLQKMFAAFPASVRFFHNDAKGLVCAPYLQEIGVNLFNFSFEHSMAEIRALAGDAVTLLGNIPPRDVFAAGVPQDVLQAVQRDWAGLADRTRVIWSCGGGMPPQVPSENIRAFIETVRQLYKQDGN